MRLNNFGKYYKTYLDAMLDHNKRSNEKQKSKEKYEVQKSVSDKESSVEQQSKEPTNTMIMKMIILSMQQMAQSISVLTDIVITICKTYTENKTIVECVTKLQKN